MEMVFKIWINHWELLDFNGLTIREIVEYLSLSKLFYTSLKLEIVNILLKNFGTYKRIIYLH